MHPAEANQFFPELSRTIERLTADFTKIDAERRQQLAQVATFVEQNLSGDDPIFLTFICTHNSRRSHMSQIWAQTAANYYGLRQVETYSGGTESTAFNPRAVAAMRRAGFQIEQTTRSSNPIYHVHQGPEARVITAFSKVYEQAPNPNKNFCAVMTCSEADQACPAVIGAAKRIAIPYIDPKVSDNTPAEAKTYDERCHQIGREMFYIFSLIKK